MRQASKAGKHTPEWVARPERSNVPTMRLIVWIALNLGRPAARVLLLPIAAYFLLFSARATRSASRAYLERVLGRKPAIRDLYRHYHTFASVILDRVFLLGGCLDKLDVRLENAEAVQTALGAGRGCILLGAHVGSFEAIRAAGQQRQMPPANLVMYEENARKLNAVLHAIDPGLAQRIIPLGKPNAMLRVRDALARGEFVGMLADRVIEGEGSVACEFLGEPARFPTGPLRMAALMKAPVVVMAALYLGGNRYEVHFDPLPLPHQATEADIAPAVQAYAARIEHYCRIAPYNWFNFYDFWR
ncbi:MAG TPA: acyl-CoA synthetase [Gallionellaceae bacterium]|nr:acyl-CoA synthetase [Gallionellaceae bacterium]